MPISDLRNVFHSRGKIQIVLSTMIAETSITIDDIAFVIDTGKVKIKSFDALIGVSTLQAEWATRVSISNSTCTLSNI